MSIVPTGKYQYQDYLRPTIKPSTKFEPEHRTISKKSSGKGKGKGKSSSSSSSSSSKTLAEKYHFDKQYAYYSFCRKMSDRPEVVRTSLTRKQFRKSLYHLGIDYSACFEAVCKNFKNPDRLIAEENAEYDQETIVLTEEEIAEGKTIETKLDEIKVENRLRINHRFDIIVGCHGFLGVDQEITEILTKYPHGDLLEQLKTYSP